MAEQLSAAGVAVFAADIKGDLSGVSQPGEESEKLAAKVRAGAEQAAAEARAQPRTEPKAAPRASQPPLKVTNLSHRARRCRLGPSP
jgi:hypothetical protein